MTTVYYIDAQKVENGTLNLLNLDIKIINIYAICL